jgi:hypothetical protein
MGSSTMSPGLAPAGTSTLTCMARDGGFPFLGAWCDTASKTWSSDLTHNSRTRGKKTHCYTHHSMAKKKKKKKKKKHAAHPAIDVDPCYLPGALVSSYLA